MLKLFVLLAAMVAGSDTTEALARPFMDSAKGHCLICELFSDETDAAGSAQDDAPASEPEERRDSLG